MTSSASPYPAGLEPPPPAFPMVPDAARPDPVTRWVTAVVDRCPRWTGPALSLVGVAGAVGYTYLVRPTSVTAGMHPACLVKVLTGFDCPGCGGTRAAWYLLHGDLAEAAVHHPVFVMLVPFLIYMYGVWALNTVLGRKLPQIRPSSGVLVAFLAGWFVFSILRNLPWAPFTVFYV